MTSVFGARDFGPALLWESDTMQLVKASPAAGKDALGFLRF